MFLIEYEEGVYINAEQINWMKIKKEFISFTLIGDMESVFMVLEDYQQTFANHLQKLNSNINSVENKYHEVFLKR